MIKLINDECINEMSKMQSKSIDMILCDLPYGVLNKSNKNTNWDKPINFDKLWAEYERIIKDNGAIVLFGSGMFTAELMLSNKKMWKYNIIWNKKLISGFLNAKRMPLRQHEDICVFYKKQPIFNPQFTLGQPLHSIGKKNIGIQRKNNNYGNFSSSNDDRSGSCQKYPTSIVSFNKPHPSISIHPTQKPVDLLEYLIKTYTNENMIILDNCMGSGSTGVACVKTNRKFIGIELDENYFNIACKRIKNELAMKLPYEGHEENQSIISI